LPSTVIILKIVFIQSELGPILYGMLLSFRIRNDSVQFGFIPETRPDQAEISYSAHIHVRWILAKLMNLMFII